MKVSDGLRDHVHEKVARHMADFPRIIRIQVILTVEKYRHIADLIVLSPPRLRIEARHVSRDMYASIDGALEKARVQLRNQVDKLRRKPRTRLGALEADVPGETTP